MRLKLTPSSVEKLRPPEKGETYVWDTGLPGFGIRVGKRRRTGVVQYRRGTTHRMGLGTYPAFSLPAARAKAASVSSSCAGGA